MMVHVMLSRCRHRGHGRQRRHEETRDNNEENGGGIDYGGALNCLVGVRYSELPRSRGVHDGSASSTRVHIPNCCMVFSSKPGSVWKIPREDIQSRVYYLNLMPVGARTVR